MPAIAREIIGLCNAYVRHMPIVDGIVGAYAIAGRDNY
jgi:hypothetical protein